MKKKTLEGEKPIITLVAQQSLVHFDIVLNVTGFSWPDKSQIFI